MTQPINQDQIEELAKELGLSPWPLETTEAGYAFYIDRDIDRTSLYNLARVTIPQDQGPITAYCGLYNSQGNKIGADTIRTYDTVELMIKGVHERFDHLRAPFKPSTSAPRKVKQSRPKQFLN